MPIPTLETDRLTLRAPKADDFAMDRDFYADPDASHFYGGPLEPGQAWRKLAFDIGHWALRGYGMWTLVEARDGRARRRLRDRLA